MIMRRTHYPISYERWEAWLRTSRKRKLANNTWLDNTDGPTYPKEDGYINRIAIVFHSTRIITFHPDGGIELNSGGWRTITTRDRIRRFSDIDVFTWGGVWFVRFAGNTYIYEDDIRLFAGGAWLNGEQCISVSAREVVNERKRYRARARRKANGIKRKGARRLNFDDWDAYLKRDDGKTTVQFVHRCELNLTDRWAALGRKMKRCRVCKTELPQSIRMAVELQRINRG